MAENAAGKPSKERIPVLQKLGGDAFNGFVAGIITVFVILFCFMELGMFVTLEIQNLDNYGKIAIAAGVLGSAFRRKEGFMYLVLFIVIMAYLVMYGYYHTADIKEFVDMVTDKNPLAMIILDVAISFLIVILMLAIRIKLGAKMSLLRILFVGFFLMLIVYNVVMFFLFWLTQPKELAGLLEIIMSFL